MTPSRIMTLDPGHFHAALVHKEMLADLDPVVHVYGDLGPDLLGHLQRLSGFNNRAANPTKWQVEVHAGGGDPMARMFAERPGQVVVLSGRNDLKIDRILASVEAGLHVLADKPWVIDQANLPKLERALDLADRKGLVIYDMMTERHEITSLLCRELVNDADVFGGIVPGDKSDPGVYMTSTHYLLKLVAGVPNRRPAWYFDIRRQGEGLSDVGTHLVDLVMWTLLPGKAVDFARDVKLVAATRKPTLITKADYQRVTGEPDFPDYLRPALRDGVLPYFANTYVDYTLAGTHVRLDVLWDFEQPVTEGDTYIARFRGARSTVEIRQDKGTGWKPELYIVPRPGAGTDAVRSAVTRLVGRVQDRWPGVGCETAGSEVKLTLPDKYRYGHEAHFAGVMKSFLSYLADRSKLPAWERPNMIAKYSTTNGGVELSRRS